jgi:phosphoenolpyruvate phosphomutase
MIQRAIIVAAGMGRRLAPYTDDRPKAMVEINGRTILEHQIAAYRAIGVDDICVVRGYCAESVNLPGLRYFENPNFRRNNILASMFFAEPAMEGGFYFSYSDIVFRPEATRALAEADVDVGLIVDRRWDEAYEGRDLHPISEAELCAVEAGASQGDGRYKRVRALGKRVVPAPEAHGEFIGLAKFSAAAAETMRREYRKLERELGPEAPFGTAQRFESAYVTDLLNHLIADGADLRAVDIHGGWREIDTVQDLERARAIVQSW